MPRLRCLTGALPFPEIPTAPPLVHEAILHAGPVGFPPWVTRKTLGAAWQMPAHKAQGMLRDLTKKPPGGVTYLAPPYHLPITDSE